MAYSNSVRRPVLLDGGSTFLRGLMWAGIAPWSRSRSPPSFDYKWLKTFAWPLYFANLGLLVLTSRSATGVGGAARWVAIGPLQFQFSELAKILMIVVLANYLGARQDGARLAPSILGAACSSRRRGCSCCSSPTSGTSLVFGAILAGMLFMSGASLTLARR